LSQGSKPPTAPPSISNSLSFDELRNAIQEIATDTNGDNEYQNFLDFIEDLPNMRPNEIFDKLGSHGYVAQNEARRALSLMAYRHVQRICRIYLDNIPASELPAKSNMLLIGPTGSGKTYITELLFRHILKLPTVLVDITTYSETGYVGQDVMSILTRLLFASEGNLPLAEVGVVCLDEFDKIASGQNNAVFAGAGTTKDISGLGVQRELLKLLESAELTVPTEFSHSSYQQHVLMSTRNIPFIACGAFSGFKLITQLYNQQPSIGFHNENKEQLNHDIAVSFRQDEVDQTRHFQQYGFLPELIARFDRIVPFKALDEEALSSILKRNLISAYEREFELEGFNLMIDESLLKHLVKEAIRRETGARGLRATLSRYLEEAAFETFSSPDASNVRVSWEQGRLHVDKS
tara:strand:+ start:13680 stop:14897 length:1218 start_codon:yes stop_codon:yes gene_type:complete